MKIPINKLIGIPHTNLVTQVLPKPGLVAEICPSGFAHPSHLPSDWLMLDLDSFIISNRETKGVATFPSNQDDWVVPLLWFPVLFGFKVLSAQKQHIGWFP